MTLGNIEWTCVSAGACLCGSERDRDMDMVGGLARGDTCRHAEMHNDSREMQKKYKITTGRLKIITKEHKKIKKGDKMTIKRQTMITKIG